MRRPILRHWAAGPPPPTKGWSRTRWLIVIAFIFATHVGLVLLFGEKKLRSARCHQCAYAEDSQGFPTNCSR